MGVTLREYFLQIATQRVVGLSGARGGLPTLLAARHSIGDATLGGLRMSKRKKVFVALVGVAVMVLGGIAYAAWTADGSGTGRAHARSAITVGVNVATGT